MCRGHSSRSTCLLSARPQHIKGSCTECYTWADLQGEKFLSRKADLISRDHMLACLFPKEPTISCGKNSVLLALGEEGIGNVS